MPFFNSRTRCSASGLCCLTESWVCGAFRRRVLLLAFLRKGREEEEDGEVEEGE